MWCDVETKEEENGRGRFMDGWMDGWGIKGRALLLRGLYVKSKQLGPNHFIVL